MGYGETGKLARDIGKSVSEQTDNLLGVLNPIYDKLSDMALLVSNIATQAASKKYVGSDNAIATLGTGVRVSRCNYDDSDALRYSSGVFTAQYGGIVNIVLEGIGTEITGQLDSRPSASPGTIYNSCMVKVVCVTTASSIVAQAYYHPDASWFTESTKLSIPVTAGYQYKVIIGQNIETESTGSNSNSSIYVHFSNIYVGASVVQGS